MDNCFRLLVLALLTALTGCEAMQGLLADMDKPSARVTGANLQNLTVDGATLAFDIEIGNPYDVPLPLVNLDYGLSSGGANFLSGKANVQGSVPAKGKRTITVPATLTFRELLSAAKGVKLGDVVPYAAQMDLSVDAPAVGELKLPLRKEGELPVPNVPQVELASVNWGELTLQNAEAVLAVKVKNTNQFPLDLSAMNYALSLGGKSVADTRVSKAMKLGAGESGTIEIPLRVRPIELGVAAFNMLKSGDATYQLGGDMAVGTPFGPMTLPFNSAGTTKMKS